MNYKTKMLFLSGVVSIWFITLTGCVGLHNGSSTSRSSSLVEFLYPNDKSPPRVDATPELRIPIRVGLAFIPSNRESVDADLSAAQREQLLEKIKQRFVSKKFVADITLIPDYYLARRGGFEGLAGVQRLYNVDVVALVSYDQVTHTDDNDWSLGYMTIVGAYILKGTRHDVSTLVDLAVIDPASRSLILRAGGIDTQHGNTTLINDRRETREARSQSFDAATLQMIDHFDAALTRFEADVRDGKAQVRVVNKDGSPRHGGGALSLWSMAALIILLSIASFQKRMFKRKPHFETAGAGISDRTQLLNAQHHDGFG